MVNGSFIRVIFLAGLVRHSRLTQADSRENEATNDSEGMSPELHLRD